MTSGRMKGQAFISYSSTEEAAEALKETNGYKLYDKPIVVVSSHYNCGLYKSTINGPGAVTITPPVPTLLEYTSLLRMLCSCVYWKEH